MKRFLELKLDHVLFWALTIFFHAYTRTDLVDQVGVGFFAQEVLVRNTLLAGAVYSVLWFVLPKFASGKKMLSAVPVLMVAVASYILTKNSHDLYLQREVLGNMNHHYSSTTLYNFSIIVFYLAFASALHLSKEWFLQQELIRNMEISTLNTELAYLRAQINPHFLFNSINTIYFQIDKQNVEARETLSKFSDMLRYQLYECNEKEIPIEKEITYLNSYVNLQRLRKGDSYNTNFSCSEKIKGFKIPPLLLIPFVENAFKHVSSFTDKKNEIEIQLTIKPQWFQLLVYNTCEDSSTGEEAGGIGLKNVTRRLELLYGNSYKLDIVRTPESFSITLQLPLS